MQEKLIAELRELARQALCKGEGINPHFVTAAIDHHEAEQGEWLREAISIMENARNHGGPVAYADADDSVGSYVCCGGASYKDHNKDCWYRKMCEFLDSHPTPTYALAEAKARAYLMALPDKGGKV